MKRKKNSYDSKYGIIIKPYAPRFISYTAYYRLYFKTRTFGFYLL